MVYYLFCDFHNLLAGLSFPHQMHKCKADVNLQVQYVHQFWPN